MEWSVDPSCPNFGWATSAINLDGGTVIYLAELNTVGARTSEAPLSSCGGIDVVGKDNLRGCILFKYALGYPITGFYSEGVG